MQGIPPNLCLFKMVFHPFLTLICTIVPLHVDFNLEDPSGFRPFVNDMVLHSVGPEAIPSMSIIITANIGYI